MAMCYNATMKVKLTFIEPVLGMDPGNKEMQKKWLDFLKSKVQAKAEQVYGKPDEEAALLRASDRIESAEEDVKVFPRDEMNRRLAWNFQLRGLIKEGLLNLLEANSSEKDSIFEKGKAKSATGLSAYTARRLVDGSVFVVERSIPFDNVDEANVGFCHRRLRGQTQQGERISIAVSEQIPAGCSITFTIGVLKTSLIPYIKQVLDYGKIRGSFGWRNSGKGCYTWELLEEAGPTSF